MIENKNTKKYDLEERTERFAKSVRDFTKGLGRTLANIEDAKQVIRSSGSVAANYIEANEALSRKDFIVRIKICRKESKESGMWLRLLDVGVAPEKLKAQETLVGEAVELMKIFGAILRRSE